MQLKTQALVAAVVAAFVAQGAIAADAPKKKATAGECAEQAQMPKAGSEKSRAEVKKEVKEAVKSGELSKSDAMEKQKK